jgi:leucyl aminopeptidase
MQIKLSKTSEIHGGKSIAVVVNDFADIPKNLIRPEEKDYLKKQHKELKKNLVCINRLTYNIYIFIIEKDKKDVNDILEDCRKAGDKLAQSLNTQKTASVFLTGSKKLKKEVLAVCEGMLLGNYQFLQYKTKAEENKNTLSAIQLIHDDISTHELKTLQIITTAVFRCRDLVNEPVIKLNATALAEAFTEMSKESGIRIEVLNKARIEALKMGGLLAVNYGSVDPPTFTIMEYKPEGALNKKPYVLVGKGVVFDTGGISLKPSASMSDMKCDMAGAAAAGCTIYAVAKAKLPVWIVALMPATDNRPSGNAQVPGDVITMFDGTTVEVLNTDAEGRLILADALAYAKKYKPTLVIDMATLTGAAQAAIGKYGIVAMHSKCDTEFSALQECGKKVRERVVEFPFWDDYKELIKSDVADIKNIGGPYAGAITAGKFLEHFTDYPYIHLDIAGPAFLEKRDTYLGLGGTGVGIRLLFEFFAAKTGKK